MASNLERRVQTLESNRAESKTAAEMTDKELLSILMPVFGARVPTDDDLRELVARWASRSTGGCHGNA